MTSVFITIAFVLGFLVRQVGLPPLIGFLTAGFALNALGFEGGEGLQVIADLGVTLLLFSIGSFTIGMGEEYVPLVPIIVDSLPCLALADVIAAWHVDRRCPPRCSSYVVTASPG